MRKKFRQLHLWIGLITSILILVEAVTGLLLSEPWLMGQTFRTEMRMPMQAGSNSQAAVNRRQNPPADAADQSAPAQQDSAQQAGPGPGGQAGSAMGKSQQSSSLVGLIHGLHEGRIGSTDVKWLADLAAIGLILLTVTGIYLSIQTLRGQSRSRKRKLTGQSVPE